MPDATNSGLLWRTAKLTIRVLMTPSVPRRRSPLAVTHFPLRLDTLEIGYDEDIT